MAIATHLPTPTARALVPSVTARWCACASAIGWHWLMVPIILLSTPAWSAQQAEPDLGYAFPGGGQQGNTVQVLLGGQRLRGAQQVYISGEHISGEVIAFFPPVRNVQKEARLIIQDQILTRAEELWQQMTAGGAVSGDPPWQNKRQSWRRNQKQLEQIDREQVRMPKHPLLEHISKKSLQELEHLYVTLFEGRFMQQPNAQLAETVLVELRIGNRAACGIREIRLLGRQGLSDPVRFAIGELPETNELEHNDPDRPGLFGPPVPVDLPICINGQIMPGDADAFRFRARAGDPLCIRVQARELVPFLADAVPGWFQAVVELTGPDGQQVAFVDDHGFNPDPLLYCRVPATGLYQISIRDAIYRGRNDFVYRLHISNEQAPRSSTASSEHNVLNQAKAISLPFTHQDRLEATDRQHFYTFTGEAGDPVVVDVDARRMNSDLDSVIYLLDDQMQTIAWNDDQVDKVGHLHRGMDTHTHFADSYLSTRLPRMGRYFLRLTDSRGHGGNNHHYALRVSQPQPDFRLYVTPSGLNLPVGRDTPITVHILRQDGFDGAVDVSLHNAPEGFSLDGGRIPPELDEIRCTIKAPVQQDARQLLKNADIIPLVIRGEADHQGRRLMHPAIAADNVMQAFLWRHLQESTGLVATVLRSSFPYPAELATTTPVRIPEGSSEHIIVSVVGLKPDPDKAKLELTLVDPPAGVDLRHARFEQGRISFDLSCLDLDGEQIADNLIVEVLATTIPDEEQRTKGRKPVTRTAGYLPSIPVVLGCDRHMQP